MSCDYMGHEFGASYPDSICIDGYLWDADSGEANPDGSGTTGAVSVRWKRRFIGCDLRESQVQLSRRRIETETPMMFVE